MNQGSTIEERARARKSSLSGYRWRVERKRALLERETLAVEGKQ